MNLQEQNRFRDQLREFRLDMERLSQRLASIEIRVNELVEAQRETLSAPQKRGPGRPRKVLLLVKDEKS